MKEFHTYGPPGTGKTTDMVHQISRAVQKRGYHPEEVMVTSFTRAAAQTVRDREPQVEPQNVGTVHSHSRSLMKEKRKIAEDKIKEFNKWCEEKGVPHFQLGDRVYVSKRSPDAVAPDGSDDAYADLLFSKMMIKRSRMEQIRPDEDRGQLALFAQAWEEWKQEADYVDFTDMLENAFKSDRVPDGVRIFFGDEAQDFDKLQMSLIRKWARDMDALVLFGDDDQCLYSWNGASVENLLGVTPDHSRVLGHSYRLPVAVFDKAVSFIETYVKNRVPKTFTPTDEPGFVDRISSPMRALPGETCTIAQQHADAGDTVMILVSCNFMLTPVIKTLRERGVPFHNPYRMEEGTWNPMRFDGQSTAHRVWCFMRGFSEDQWSSQGPRWTGPQMAMWMPLVGKEAFRPGVTRKDAIARAENRGGSELIDITKYRLWFNGDPFHGLGLNAFEMAGKWLIHNAVTSKVGPMQLPVRIAQHGLDKIKKRPNIVVGTIHSVKGAEADIVILSPDISTKAAIELNPSVRSDGNMGLSMKAQEDLARVFYVGMTRARKGLYITHPQVSLRGPWRAMKGLY